MTITRRTFFLRSLSGASALSTTAMFASVAAQTSSAVVETDPQALALGYRTDSSQVDVKKHPNYSANQRCMTCVLFQGKAADDLASCTVFANKLVSGKAWCSAWTKKA